MKKPSLVFLTLAVLTVCSCTDMTELDTAMVSDAATIDALVQTAVSSDAVTMEDIRSIATATSGKTRTSSTAYTLSSIDDADGNPVIYVINFENDKGFILVSATKNYMPVLAYSDTGNFTVSDDMPEGLKMWKEETMSAIEYVNTLPEDSVAKYRDRWRQYEEPAVPVSSPVSMASASSDLDNAYAIVRDFIIESVADGYEVLDVNESMTGDDSLDEDIRDYIQGYIYPVYLQYWEDLSVVRTKVVDEITTVDNFMETIWGQSSGYNISFPKNSSSEVRALVGCGPLAAGQIMYYYKYPSSFDWDSMLPNSATTATSDMLYDVANRANAVFWSNANNETSTTFDNINSALKSYGYTTSTGDHVASKAWRNIEGEKPVLMTATDSNKEHGHAWVASGGKYTNSYTTLEIYTFYNRTNFVCADTYNKNYFQAYYFYMNWGWGGTSNGVYYDSTLVVPGSVAYTAENRQDIYDITPQ